MFKTNTALSADFVSDLMRSINNVQGDIHLALRDVLTPILGYDRTPNDEQYEIAITAMKKAQCVNREFIAKISTIVRPAVRNMVFMLFKDDDENVAWQRYKQLNTKEIEKVVQGYCSGTIPFEDCKEALLDYANNVQILFCDVETLDNKE